MGHDPDTERLDPTMDDPDASSLAGVSEYSATGGGSQPLHRPQLRSREGADEAVMEMESIRELYRYSLARATGDTYADDSRSTRSDDGPLHLKESLE